MRKTIRIHKADAERISEVFCKRFNVALAHDGLHHADIARKLNLTQPAFSHAINGKRISLPFAVKVAQALDLSLDWLCGFEDEDGSN